MAMFTLYAYIMPYKDTLINMIELLFQLCSLLFLLMRSTRQILTDYLVFPDSNAITGDCSDETGIATLTWLLLPVAYFPLFVILALFSGWLILRMW